MRIDGIPGWLRSAPVDELTRLADLVPNETDAAIARLTREFQAAEFKHRPTAQPPGNKTEVANDQPAAVSPPAKKLKRSTERGEGRAKLISALTKHHKYADGGCLNLEPIGNNALARLAKVSESTASAFFNKEFDGHTKYRAVCRDATRLVPALKLLNQEFPAHILFGRAPPGGRPPRRRRIAGGLFDHSASLAEHLQDFLAYAKGRFCRRFRAILTLFGIFLPNAAPTGIRTAWFGNPDLVEKTTMPTESIHSPLALRPREAAKALGISPRLLWQLTHDGTIPFVKVGRTVLYPMAELQAWLSRQAEAAKGGNNDNAR